MRSLIMGGQLVDGKKRPNVDDEAGSSIRGGAEQALKPGDVLFIPSGVPHGFKDVKGFRVFSSVSIQSKVASSNTAQGVLKCRIVS